MDWIETGGCRPALGLYFEESLNFEIGLYFEERMNFDMFSNKCLVLVWKWFGLRLRDVGLL